MRDYLKPGTSALFMVIEQATPDKAIAALQQYGGTVIKTSLSDEDTQKLQEALTPEPRARLRRPRRDRRCRPGVGRSAAQSVTDERRTMRVVGAETHQTLSGISAGDVDMLDTAIGLREANREGSGLDPRTFALVKIASPDRARRAAGVVRLADRATRSRTASRPRTSSACFAPSRRRSAARG